MEWGYLLKGGIEYLEYKRQKIIGVTIFSILKMFWWLE